MLSGPGKGFIRPDNPQDQTVTPMNKIAIFSLSYNRISNVACKKFECTEEVYFQMIPVCFT